MYRINPDDMLYMCCCMHVCRLCFRIVMYGLAYPYRQACTRTQCAAGDISKPVVCTVLSRFSKWEQVPKVRNLSDRLRKRSHGEGDNKPSVGEVVGSQVRSSSSSSSRHGGSCDHCYSQVLVSADLFDEKHPTSHFTMPVGSSNCW